MMAILAKVRKPMRLDPHFAICTKLADLFHTYKSLTKLLHQESESQNRKLIERNGPLQKVQISSPVLLK